MPGRISNKADPAGKPFPAGANTQGSRLHRYRVWSLFALIIAVLVGSVAYWLYSRDQGPVVLSVGAGPYRSDSHELMKEVADVVARHSDTIRLKVIATSDSSRNISLLNADKVDMATIRSDTPVVNAVRMVADLFPDYFQIITRRDRGIDTVPDLGGKRIAIPRFGTDEFRSFWIVGDHYDLPIEKMDWKVMQFGAASQALLSGKVDALFTVRSLRDRLLINLFEDAELVIELLTGSLDGQQASGAPDQLVHQADSVHHQPRVLTILHLGYFSREKKKVAMRVRRHLAGTRNRTVYQLVAAQAEE